MGIGVAVFALGNGLSLSGYQAAQGLAQPTTALTTIRLCMGLIPAVLLDQNKIDEAKEELSTWKAVFGDRFYLEIQRYGSDGLKKKQEEYIQKAMFLAANNQVPLVATHPIQFMHTDDFRAHESKTCIADGYVLADQRRPKDFTPEQYFKTAEEMQDLFHDVARPGAAAGAAGGAARGRGGGEAAPDCDDGLIRLNSLPPHTRVLSCICAVVVE